MDPKTKQLVEEAEARASFANPIEIDVRRFYNAKSAADVPILCSAVREQDKRARHAEAERDAFSERIAELERQQHEVIQACLGRDVKDALASQVLGLWKSQSVLIDRVLELETRLKERTEAAAAWDKLAVARLKTINEQASKIQDMTIEINQLRSLVGDDIS